MFVLGSMYYDARRYSEASSTLQQLSSIDPIAFRASQDLLQNTGFEK